ASTRSAAYHSRYAAETAALVARRESAGGPGHRGRHRPALRRRPAFARQCRPVAAARAPRLAAAVGPAVPGGHRFLGPVLAVVARPPRRARAAGDGAAGLLHRAPGQIPAGESVGASAAG